MVGQKPGGRTSPTPIWDIVEPVHSSLEQLLQRLLPGAQAPKPALPAKTGSSDIESLLQSLLLGTLALAAWT